MPPALLQKAENLTNLYPSFKDFYTRYSPYRQEEFAADERKTIMDDFSPVTVLDAAYGPGCAASWINFALAELNTFSGTKNINDEQTMSLARLIIREYGDMKISMFQLFFYRFKCGDFGKFYGMVDPMAVTCALKDFVADCKCKRQEYLNEEYEARKAEKDSIMTALRNRWFHCHGDIVRNCESEDDKRLFDDLEVYDYDKQSRTVYLSAYKETIYQIEIDRLMAVFKPAFQHHFPTLRLQYYVRPPKKQIPEKLTRQTAPKKKMESVADILVKAKSIVNNAYGADADTLQQQAWQFQQRHLCTPMEYIEKFDKKVND